MVHTSGVHPLVSRLFVNKYDCYFSRTPECNVLAHLTSFDQFLVIWLSYVFIVVKLRCGNQPRHHGAANRERKLTITLFTVTSTSLLLWLPHLIASFLFFCH